MEKLIIRNSMLNDWESMCQLAFRARWFGTDEEKAKMDIGHKQSIRWGSYFEQLVFGSGVGGKTIELTEKEIRSEAYPRVKRQAKEARNYLFKEIGMPFIKAQVQLFGSIEVQGQLIPCEGNIDGQFGNNKIPEVNVDTKYTGDTENTYGKYAWGKPEEMDMGQLVMYRELSYLNYGIMPRSIYYVADSKPAERVEVIEPVFSQGYIDWYKERLRDAYREISQAVNFNYWKPTAGYNECKQCPLRDSCPSAIKIPSIKIVEK